MLRFVLLADNLLYESLGQRNVYVQDATCSAFPAGGLVIVGLRPATIQMGLVHVGLRPAIVQMQ